MGTWLRLGSILLTLGTILLSIAAYTSLRRASLAAVSGQGSLTGLGLASWASITLMIAGGIVVLVALFWFIRNILAAKIYISDKDEGRKLRLSHQSEQSSLRKEQSVEDFASILNQILQIKYAALINWPRWVRRIYDQATAEKLSRIAQNSIRHFATTATMIRQLGGSPSRELEFELQRDEKDLGRVLNNQLQKEKLVQELFQKAAELTADDGFRQQLNICQREEDEHIQTIQEALSTLLSRT